MKRITLLCAVFVLSFPPSAGAAAARPSIRLVISSAPNRNGWWRAPVTASLSVTGISRVDSCQGSYGFDDAHARTGVLRAFRTAGGPASACRQTVSVSRPGSADIDLRARAGRWSARKSYSLQMDNVAPAITLTANAGKAQRAPQHLEGEVTDDYSGAQTVTLHFVDTLGVASSFYAPATCSGCQSVRCWDPCQTAAAWSYVGNIPSGSWDVTATVADLAGNSATSTRVQLVALAA